LQFLVNEVSTVGIHGSLVLADRQRLERTGQAYRVLTFGAKDRDDIPIACCVFWAVSELAGNLCVAARARPASDAHPLPGEFDG